MTDYTKTTNFAAKDNLVSGNPAKVVKGSEIDTEYNNIAVAIATKSNIASPTFTGTATIPTVDINAGNIDGTIIGASSAAAGTFTSVTTSGNVTVGGNLTVTGNAVISGNLTFGDADTDNISFAADVNSNILPNIDDTYDLGSSTKEWRNLYIDGTANIDSLVADTADINGGTLDGVVIGGSSAAAGTFTTATATTGNITTVNATTVDSTNVEVTNLKAKDGTASATIADVTGVMTVASAVLTTADINGGTADAVVIGGATPAAGTFTSLNATGGGALTGTWSNLGSVTTIDINGGTIDGAVIGGSSAAAGSFTTISASGTITGPSGTWDAGGVDIATGDTYAINSVDVLSATTLGSSVVNSSLTSLGTITSLVATTADINGGTIDGAVIGGASAAAITGTTGQFNTSLNVDGTITADGLTVDGSANVTGNVFVGNSTAAAPFAATYATLSSSTGSELVLRNSSGIVTGEIVGGVAFGHDDTTTGGAPHYAGIQARSVDSSGTMTLNFYTGLGNYEALTPQVLIDASGNVGIGTTTPAAKLDIYTGTTTAWTGSITGAAIYTPQSYDGAAISAGTDGFASLYFESAGLTSYLGERSARIVTYPTPASSYGTNIGFAQRKIDGTFVESVTINGSGNVGIGTTTVTESLDANGNIKLRASAAARYVYSAVGDSTTVDAGHKYDPVSDYVATLTAGSERMRVDSSGNVGIGTSSPASQMHLISANPEIRLQSSGASTTGEYSILSRDGSNVAHKTNIKNDTSSLTFGTGGNSGNSYVPIERMRIDSSGNVGIGTTSPSTYTNASELVVDTGTLGGMTIKSGTTGYGAIFFADGTTGNEQYRGFIQYNHGYLGDTDQLLIGTAATTRMVIDSSGNVGIGVTPSAWYSGNKVIDIGTRSALWSGGAGQPNLGHNCYVNTSGNFIYKATTSANYYTQDGGHKWYNAASGTAGTAITFTQAMTLDASGNLLVGTTSTSSNVSGVRIYPTQVQATASNAITANFNRVNSDGDIVKFSKDGTTVGSIGTAGGSAYIGGYQNSGLYFNGTSDIRPWNTSTQTKLDNSLDLGSSTARFKDLYLSGGVYVGGTTSANLLDDYEEGTFTPVLADASSGGNEATASASGRYTKVGRLVNVMLQFIDINTTGLTSGNQIFITGLPFTAVNIYSFTPVTINVSNTTLTEGDARGSVHHNSSYISLSEGTTSGGAALTVGDLASGAADIYISVSYEAQ